MLDTAVAVSRPAAAPTTTADGRAAAPPANGTKPAPDAGKTQAVKTVCTADTPCSCTLCGSKFDPLEWLAANATYFNLVRRRGSVPTRCRLCPRQTTPRHRHHAAAATPSSRMQHLAWVVCVSLVGGGIIFAIERGERAFIDCLFTSTR